MRNQYRSACCAPNGLGVHLEIINVSEVFFEDVEVYHQLVAFGCSTDQLSYTVFSQLIDIYMCFEHIFHTCYVIAMNPLEIFH